MKNLTLAAFILAIFLSVNIFTTRARPTNDWLIIYDDNQTVIFEAESISEALGAFNKTFPNRRVFSAAQRSYVQSVWIWEK